MKCTLFCSDFRYCSYFVPACTATLLPASEAGDVMCLGLPPATMSARWECMYGTAGNCLVRSCVTKMPESTTSHFFAPSAGNRPLNAVCWNLAVPPICLAIAAAMSMSKPMGLPAVVVDSIGGNVGSSQ